MKRRSRGCRSSRFKLGNCNFCTAVMPLEEEELHLVLACNWHMHGSLPALPRWEKQYKEESNAIPVLCVARNVACNVRGGFFNWRIFWLTQKETSKYMISDLVHCHNILVYVDTRTPTLSSGAQNVLKRILDPNPATLITTAEIKADEWFREDYGPSNPEDEEENIHIDEEAFSIQEETFSIH
ncbi:hypothetical protein Nepgr_003819 [Nepenthes gracilis]|uniref:Uncharacterized protein n=1 Tax=Nepenthes gracilis TaxID=150966 RepID=A0AAD3XED9_NEPGR|nr:hypothetical protein Nepgr_003819 [Nepenthes gracilis]